MPTFKGQVDEEDLIKLLAFIKSLKPGRTPVRNEDFRRRRWTPRKCRPAAIPSGARACPLIVVKESACGLASFRQRASDKEEWSTMSSAITTGFIPQAKARPPRAAGENYLNAAFGVKSWLLTTDHKRIAILYLLTVTVLFFLGGAAATVIRLNLMTPDRRSGAGRHLQQTVLGSRHHHGVVLSGAGGADRAGQFHPAHDDRRARPRLSQAESAELVHLHHRRHHHPLGHPRRRRRYRLDVLHALQHANRPAPTSFRRSSEFSYPVFPPSSPG